MPRFGSPARPKGPGYPAAWLEEIWGMNDERPLSDRLSALGGFFSVRMHPDSVRELAGIARTYDVALEVSHDLATDIDEIRYWVIASNPHTLAWTPTSDRRISITLDQNDVNAIGAGSNEAVVYFGFFAGEVERHRVTFPILIGGEVAGPEDIEEWAHEDQPNVPVPQGKQRGAVPSELGDYELAGEYALVGFDGSALTYNSIQPGQIILNASPTSNATNARIHPLTEELSIFTERAREGAEIRFGSWRGTVTRVTRNGNIFTFVIDTATANRPDLNPGNYDVSVKGYWESQVDARARTLVDAETEPLYRALRNRPITVVGWGAFTNAELVADFPPVAFTPTYSETAGAMLAAGRWYLDPAAAGIANAADNPMWRATVVFNYVDGAYVRTQGSLERATTILYADNENGANATDNPNLALWRMGSNPHYGWYTSDGRFSGWFPLYQLPQTDEMLGYIYRNYTTTYNGAFTRNWRLEEFSALKFVRKVYTAGDANVRYYGEAFLRDLSAVRVFGANESTIGYGALRVLLGTGYNSLEVVGAEHGLTSIPLEGEASGGLALDFMLRADLFSDDGMDIQTYRLLAGLGSGRIELWGVH